MSANLNPEQCAAVEAREGFWEVHAAPGAGKTRVIVARYQRLVESGIKPDEIISFTFARSAAAEMRGRAKASRGGFTTFHAFALRLLLAERSSLPFQLAENPVAENGWTRRTLGDILKGVPTASYRQAKQFISLKKRAGIPPAQAIALSEDFVEAELAQVYAEYERRSREAGVLDFDSMMLEAVRLLEENVSVRARWQYRFVQLDEAPDTDNCQPPGTMVRKVIGPARGKGAERLIPTEDVPIETLRDGDHVVAWKRRWAILIKKTEAISVSMRHFDGHLLKIKCGDKETRLTPDHQLYAIMNGNGEDSYIVYLMYRKDMGFRVGQCALRYSKDTRRKPMGGPGARFVDEKAERGWILRIEKEKYTSRAWEQIISCKYSIPCATFGLGRTRGARRFVRMKTAELVFNNVLSRGTECLIDHGLSFDHPLYTRDEKGRKKAPFKRYFETAAMNLVPILMSLPSTETCKRVVIDSVERVAYSGPVYSLNVPTYHTYVADGLVVKNCQWRMVQRHSERHGNVFAVGDVNQSIYGFRGAAPDRFLSFREMFPGARTLYLSTNYRSSPQIVRFCQEIAPVRTGLVEQLKSATGDGPEPEILAFENPQHEAWGILERTEDPEHVAILVRTNRQIAALEQECLKRGMLYRLLGKTGFWSRREIQDALAFLRFAVWPLDDDALRRIILSPYKHFKYLSKAFLEGLEKPLWASLRSAERQGNLAPYQRKAVDHLTEIVRALFPGVDYKSLSVSEQTDVVLGRTAMLDYYASEEEPDEQADNSALDNLDELQRIAGSFSKLDEFLEHTKQCENAAKNGKGLTISTIHSAKGREWDTVFVAGVTDGILPHKRGDWEEERRLFYVACSRAARRLVVTYYGEPSMLIADRAPKFRPSQSVGLQISADSTTRVN